MNTQVKRIQLRGYGVRYSSSDPYEENAIKRAESVELKLRQVLGGNGIDVSAISFEIIGMADKNPIAPNNTQANRALNRRVEISLLSGSGFSMLGADSSSSDTEEGACNDLIPFPKVNYLTHKKLKKVRAGKLEIDFTQASNSGLAVRQAINNILARWSCDSLEANLLKNESSSEPYSPSAVPTEKTKSALAAFQTMVLNRTASGILDQSTLHGLDQVIGLSTRTESNMFVSMATEGIYGDPKNVLNFFKTDYDYQKHLTTSVALLNQLGGGTDLNLERIRKQFRSTYKGNFLKLKNRDKLHKPFVRSLTTIDSLPKREQIALAPSFLMGFREAGRYLRSYKAMDDSWKKSGLDFLHRMQRPMRKTGHLPSKLRLQKGSLYGELSPETNEPIESAEVPAKHILLVHAAYFNYSYHHFSKIAKQIGYQQNDIDSLSKLGKAYWLAQSFARPQGCKWAKEGCKAVGIRTIIGNFKARNKRLDDVALVTSTNRFKRKKTVNIAVRTAAAIVALDRMMARYAIKRADRLKAEYINALSEKISAT